MSYSAIPFAVDLEKVKAIFGSKDKNLFERIIQSKEFLHYKNQFPELDKRIYEIIFSYVPPGKRITKQFFGLKEKHTGSGFNHQKGHEYGYALLAVCDALGTNLSGNVAFYWGDAWNKVNEIFEERKIKINLDKMCSGENLFDIPQIKDYPMIGHYSKNEVDYLLEELNKIEIDKSVTEENCDDENFHHFVLKAFRKKLMVCKEKNTEWISFLH